jgi:hypothetical protein
MRHILSKYNREGKDTFSERPTTTQPHTVARQASDPGEVAGIEHAMSFLHVIGIGGGVIFMVPGYAGL